MRKKIETLKNKDLKQVLIDLIEIEGNNGFKIIESTKVNFKEDFEVPVYIDLSEYTEEKLNEIIDENLDDIMISLKEDDSINTLAMTFLHSKIKDIKVNFRVSNRDFDGEECINIILEY